MNFKTNTGWDYSRSVDMTGVDFTTGAQRSVVTNSAIVDDFKIDYKLGKHLLGCKAMNTDDLLWNARLVRS